MAKLVHVDEAEVPGITRHRRGQGFAYRDAQGRWLRSVDPVAREHLQRIQALAIPPAYVGVWICPWPDGHLQATGRDARGRKQYLYHPEWQKRRAQDKFERMRDFGRALTGLRQHLDDVLSTCSMHLPPTRAQVLAALVQLLDKTHIRVGNASYARDNASYGLSTLHNHHAEVCGEMVRFCFRGKSGVQHDVRLHDRRLAGIVRRCQSLPGQHLFEYRSQDGGCHPLDSGDINDCIRESMGGAFTAKDFRTWHATVHAWWLMAPPSLRGPSDQDTAWRDGPAKMGPALQAVAARLGNTAAVCRKSYVHPQLMACAAEGVWPGQGTLVPAAQALHRAHPGLSHDECCVLAFLDLQASAGDATAAASASPGARSRTRVGVGARGGSSAGATTV